MVAVVNFLRRPIGAKVTLHLDELGVPPEHRASLTAADIDDWLPPAGTKLGELHVADVPRTKSAALLAEINQEGGFPDTPADPDAGGTEEPADLETMMAEPEEGTYGPAESDDSDSPVKRDEFFTVVLKDNVLTLNVAGHNFRAIEVRRKADDQ